MAKVLESRNCNNPIAGFGKVNNCYESFEKHVRTIIDLEMDALKVASTYASLEYGRYLWSILGPELSEQLSELVLNVNTILAIYHDIGKCTIPNQVSLRERGTAPEHEYVSARVFRTIATLTLNRLSLEDAEINVITAPMYIAIILHHHAIRGGKVRTSRSSRYDLKDEDLKCIWKCLEGVKDLAGSFLVDEAIFMSEALKHYRRYNYDIKYKEELRPYYYRARAYRVASLLSVPLAVADNLSAMRNRSECLSNDESLSLRGFLQNIKISDSFVKGFLNRELVFERLHSKLKCLQET